MRIVIVYILVLIGNVIFAQTEQRVLISDKVNIAPKIDGVLNDSIWIGKDVANDFYEYFPTNGAKSSFKTEVKVIYDNNALYVGAMMYDHPDSIKKGLCERDVYHCNTDKFGIQLIPFNDGLNGYELWVTAAGVQLDFKKISSESDANWNEVWQSAVSICDSGWIAEMAIPYSALRFPKESNNDWGLNFLRVVRRKSDLQLWNHVNRQQQGMLAQCGLLTGLTNITPPLRLSFSPYLSGYIDKNTSNNTSKGYKGGLDFKYGINESFTLDMMLIPDFGQVQSDNLVLNLTPFEVQYEENRPFFTEGSELFSKGKLFYSKRIGSKPRHSDDVEDNLTSSEKIIEHPSTNQLINATKVTGRTQNGLGIGILNGMTSNTYSVIKDTVTGSTRNYSTQPFTNYNVAVFDQSLKNNSYVSLVNTNYASGNYLSNATATDFTLYDKKNLYMIRGIGAVSQVNAHDNNNYNLGGRYYLGFGKVSGPFRFRIGQTVYGENFEINDLGFLAKNNMIYYRVDFDYYNYTKFWKILRTKYSVNLDLDQIYNTKAFNDFQPSASAYAQFTNYSELSISTKVRPFMERDYFEPRVEGRMFLDRSYYYYAANFSTDERKDQVLHLLAARWKTFDKEGSGYSLGATPVISLNDRTSIIYGIGFSANLNNIGFVHKSDNKDTIHMGNRDIKTLSNTLNATIGISGNSSISFRLRHYWSRVVYDEFFELNYDGTLANTNYSDNHNINKNIFNIDMVYTWRFLPGSELSIVWKNAINQSDDYILHNNYFKDLKYALQLPQSNTLSLKVLYYLDYNKVKQTVFKH